MNDIRQIARQNAEAVRRDIPKLVADGNHVVAKFTGLHYVDCSIHSTAEEAAEAKAKHEAECPGNRGDIHSPAVELV